MGGHQKLLPVELTAAAVVGQIQNQVGTTGALEVERLQRRGIGSIVGGEAVDFKVSSRPARKEKRGQVGCITVGAGDGGLRARPIGSLLQGQELPVPGLSVRAVQRFRPVRFSLPAVLAGGREVIGEIGIRLDYA